MKIKLYPKELLEAAWKQDKKLYAHGDAAAPPKCLRCGSPLAAHLMVNALSRYADVQICEACGMDEALRDAAHTPLPRAEWDAVKSGHLKKSAEKSTCYLVQNCTFSEVFKHTYKPPMQLIERPVSELAYSRSDYDGYRWWTTWHNESGKKTPPELVKEIDELNKKVSDEEYSKLINYACDIGVENAFIQEGDTCSESFIPEFDLTGVK